MVSLSILFRPQIMGFFLDTLYLLCDLAMKKGSLEIQKSDLEMRKNWKEKKERKKERKKEIERNYAHVLSHLSSCFSARFKPCFSSDTPLE